MNKKRNQQLADDLKDFLVQNELNYDTRIYFNNKCYSFDSHGSMKVLDNIKGSECFEYANDDTVSMTFEGPLYEILNYSGGKVEHEFSQIFEKHKLYYELGNAWNLAAYSS